MVSKFLIFFRVLWKKLQFLCIFFLILSLVTSCVHFEESREIESAERDKENKNLHLVEAPKIPEKQIDNNHMQTQADYYFALAESYSLQNKSVKAIENYKLALIYDKDSSQAHYRMALEFVKLGLITQAVMECRQALKIDPRHRDSSLLLGGLLSAMHIFDEALDIYEEALTYNPDDSEISLFIGILYSEKGDFEKSIDYFQTLIRSEKIREKSKIWYYLGQVYASKTKPDLKNAKSAYITSLALKPGDVQVVLALGELYQSQNEKERAKQLYSQYQERQRENPLIAEKLSQIYIESGNLDEALVQLKVIESHDSEYLNVSFKIALVLVEQKKYKSAIKKLETLLKKSPDSEKIHFYLGSLYEEIKNYREAIKNFNNVSPVSRYYEDSVIHASYLYKLLGDVDGAIEKIEQGIERKKNSKFWLFYASMLRESNQLSEAREVLVSALKIFPGNKEIHFQLGSIYDLIGSIDKSVEHMEKVLEIDENHIEAMNYLAYIYANVTLNLDTAEHLARKALELQPDDGFILDTLGWVLFKQNRIKEAIHILEKAHNKESDESIIAEHLGDAYFRYRLPVKARIMYKKAIELEKNSTNRAKLLSKLNSMRNQKKRMESKDFSRLPASPK